MRDDELAIRLRRIYAAIDASEEADLSKVPPKVIVSKDLVAISQEFSGDLREEDISNIAHQVIHNVANLRDNLHRWATAQANDQQRVWDTFNASQSIKIIQDLSNNDKHGYPPKKGYGNSGIAPKLTEIKRSLRLTANPGEGICVLFGPAGIRTDGNGTAKVIVTGQIIDKDGKPIGDLYTVEIEALIAWEVLLREYDAPIGEDVKVTG